jgi:hypothetical protein
MNDKHGGFAFPQSHPDVAYSDYTGGGMTLRDWFAGQALAGLLADPDRNGSDNQYAKVAYSLADAMLAAREVKP